MRGGLGALGKHVLLSYVMLGDMTGSPRQGAGDGQPGGIGKTSWRL